MADIEEGVNVIAGPQRAGKSTFMEVIRRLGYGIERGAHLPPPADRYDVRATVLHDGYEYSIELDHLAAPRVIPLDDGAPGRSARELFGDVRKEEYRQLYTISLDELRRKPTSLDDGKDLSRILLGAGFGEVSDLPDIADALSDEAYDVGRTTGLQGGPIRKAIGTIEEGIDAKDDAVAQVDEYEETETELATVQDRIQAINNETDQLRDEETRLEVVASEYDSYERLLELQTQLKDADLDAVESFPLDDLERIRTLADQYEDERSALRTERNEFASSVTATEPDTYRERLLEDRASIEEFKNQLARFRGDVDRLEEKQGDLEGEWASLNEHITDLHPEWDSVEDVRAIETDLFTHADVRGRIEAYNGAVERVEGLDEEIGTRSGQVEHLEQRIDAATESVKTGITRGLLAKVLIGISIAIGLGAWAAIQIHPFVGIGLTAVGIIGIGIWVFFGVVAQAATHEGVNVEHLRAQKQERESERSAFQDQKSEAETDRETALERLEEVKVEFELPDGTSADAFGQFFDEFLDVKDRIGDLDQRQEQLEQERAALEDDLTEVAETLTDIGIINEVITEPIASSDRLFTAIERASSHLEAAESFATSEREVRGIEEDLVPYLGDWDEQETPEPGAAEFPEVVTNFIDRGGELEELAARKEEMARIVTDLTRKLETRRVSAVFDPIQGELEGGEATPLDGFKTVFEQYESINAIDDRLNAIEDELEQLNQEEDAKREEKADLESQLHQLQSDDDVHSAHKRIQKGQTKLEEHLETYAQLRIAEHLLKQLHERYLDRTTGPLLERASEIFERITDGAYETVESKDEFDDLDFVANLADGPPQESTELSDGTAEQLFLAVRLAKIQLADEPLPVLIDDSLTNFDPGHVHRTLELLSELGNGQQVFVLTCHPTMLDHIHSVHEAVYWSLDGGTFDGPSSEPSSARELLESRSPLSYPMPEIESR